MPEHKRQHYVPRFYLKGFSPDGKSINIWNIQQQRKIQSANLKNQCAKNYFYSKQSDVEEMLGNIEGRMAQVVNQIINCKVLPELGSQEHAVIILYVLTQISRTKSSAETIGEIHEKLFKHLLLPTAQAEGIDIEGVTIETKNAALYSLLLEIQLYPILLDLDFKLLTNNTNVEFVTSDNPAILYNQLMSFRNFGSNTGLAEKGLQIFLPIGPKAVLLFYDSDVYTVGKRSRRFVEIYYSKDIYKINTLQMCSALSNVYFRDKNLDIESLHRKALPFRRPKKASVDIVSHAKSNENREEIISLTRLDIKTNLTLSFLNLTKSAKKWTTEFRRQSIQPVSVARDPDFVDVFKEFRTRVANKEYNFFEFSLYLESKER